MIKKIDDGAFIKSILNSMGDIVSSKNYKKNLQIEVSEE